MDLLASFVQAAVMTMLLLAPMMAATWGLRRVPNRHYVPRHAMLLLLVLGLLPYAAFAAEVAAPGIGDRVKDWGLGIVALLAIPAAFLAARKFLVAYIGRELPNLLHKLLDAGDEDDDRLVYALARWADRKAAKLGAAGPARFQVVAADLCARVKILRGQEARVVELLQAALEAAGSAADAVADEADAAAAPPEPPAA